MHDNNSVPMLFPFDPSEFWTQMREIVKEEVEKISQERELSSLTMNTPGLTQKPLYKLDELCKLFEVSRPTIYDWIKHGKLRRVKIRSRVYFLWDEVNRLLE
jgi:excisionase family DNA binding protein